MKNLAIVLSVLIIITTNIALLSPLFVDFINGVDTVGNIVDSLMLTTVLSIPLFVIVKEYLTNLLVK